MYRKVNNIKEFCSLSLASLSSQEMSIVGSCVKRVCDLQQVGESPSSRQHSTLRRKRVNRESVESGPMCLFVEDNQHDNRKYPQFRPIAPKKNTTALQRLQQFEFKKLEPFINVCLGLVFQKICLKLLYYCIIVLPLKENDV